MHFFKEHSPPAAISNMIRAPPQVFFSIRSLGLHEFYQLDHFYTFRGQLVKFFSFFTTDINPSAYCKTHHVDRMWNFNLEMMRNSRKGSLRSPKNVSQFLEIMSRFHKNVSLFHKNVSHPKIVSLFLKNLTPFTKIYDDKFYDKRYTGMCGLTQHNPQFKLNQKESRIESPSYTHL